MPRRKLHADPAARQRAYRYRQTQPTQGHVIALQSPGRYERSLDDLLARGERFACIYADPPWQYDDQPLRGGAAKHYATMSVEAICALPVRDLALPQAHLHLWVTNAFLLACAPIFAAWGFEYTGNFVWGKPHLGTGHYWRNSHEILLLGVRGGLPAQQKNLRSWMEAPRGRHSAKPDRARDRVEQLSPGPYLELFGRSAVPGWTVWGNECLPTTGRLFKDRTG
jgi:N6-adenosine-specific RNA methylase IME4